MEKSIFTRHYGALTQKLRELRVAADLTQRDLAQLLRTPQTVVARIEQGQRRVDLIEFYRICKALKVNPKQAAEEVLDACLALDRQARRSK